MPFSLPNSLIEGLVTIAVDHTKYPIVFRNILQTKANNTNWICMARMHHLNTNIYAKI